MKGYWQEYRFTDIHIIVIMLLQAAWLVCCGIICLQISFVSINSYGHVAQASAYYSTFQHCYSAGCAQVCYAIGSSVTGTQWY